MHLAGIPLTRVLRLKLKCKHKLLVKTSISNDFVKQFVPSTNMPLKAMGAGFRAPIYSKLMNDKGYAKDSQLKPPMRLAAGR